MEHKIIVIDVSFNDKGTIYTENHKNVIKELQLQLINNGCRWANSGKEIQNFYGDKEFIVLIDNVMYTMKMNAIKYLKKDNKVHFVGTALTYSRYLKLKKLKIV